MKTKHLKKTTLLMALLTLSLGTKAQEDSTNVSHKTETAPKLEQFQNSSIVEYNGIDGGWGYGIGLRIKSIMIGYDFMFGETNDIVTNNSAFNISLGGNYRQWLGTHFFVEGTAGLGYFHSEITTRIASSTYKTETNKNNEMGLFINPRIGLKLFNFKNGNGSCSLTASYRWNFIKFKFKEEYTQDYFTVGLSFDV